MDSVKYVFSGVNLTIKRGEKVAFVGRNGEGKTTLVKLIMQAFMAPETVVEGSSSDVLSPPIGVWGVWGAGCKVGHNVQVGYFAQNQAQLLDGELTVFDTIDRVARGDIRLKIRDILGAFMFGGEASDKKVKVLSGGERTRLAMIKLLLEPVNLLILDEPTNHLDLRSKDVLKAAVKDFDGTVIVVSHDRDFLDGLVDKVYEFGGGKVREFIPQSEDSIPNTSRGKGVDTEDSLIKMWLRSHEAERGNLGFAGSPSAEKSAAVNVAETASATKTEARLSYEEQKAQARLQKKLEKAVKDAEEQVMLLEASVKMLEDKLATPEGSQDASLYEKYAKLKAQLSQAEDAWAEAMEALG